WDDKGCRGEAIVLLRLGIKEIAVKLQAVAENFVVSGYKILVFFHARNGGCVSPEIETRWIRPQTEAPIGCRSWCVVRQVDQYQRTPRPGINPATEAWTSVVPAAKVCEVRRSSDLAIVRVDARPVVIFSGGSNRDSLRGHAAAHIALDN